MLPILYQDDHLVAVDKPSGLLVHRSALDPRERRFAVQLLRDQLGRHVYPVHRLDKGASGVLLFALDEASARALGIAFSEQRVGKTYLSIVRGHPPGTGLIDHPLARAPGAPPQPALTRFRSLATCELPHAVHPYPTARYALLELQPLTGRSHQLRRHLKHLAHPIVGDSTFGKSAHNRLFHSLFGVHRLLLACVELRLLHPLTATSLTISAPLAPEFAAVVEALGWGGVAGSAKNCRLE